MSKAIQLSNPAYAVAVGYLVVLIVILLPFNINGVVDPQVASTLSSRYNLAERLFLVLLMLIPFGLSIYSINCFVVGKCVVWSWIHAVIVLLWVILFVLGAVFFSRKSNFTNNTFMQSY
jgi:hypothetical protein